MFLAFDRGGDGDFELFKAIDAAGDVGPPAIASSVALRRNGGTQRTLKDGFKAIDASGGGGVGGNARGDGDGDARGRRRRAAVERGAGRREEETAGCGRRFEFDSRVLRAETTAGASSRPERAVVGARGVGSSRRRRAGPSAGGDADGGGRYGQRVEAYPRPDGAAEVSRARRDV